MVRPPKCEPELGNCGSKFVWIYFLTFYLAVSARGRREVKHTG